MSVNATNKDVVISGIGIVSPLGIGIDAFWEGLASGRSGIAHTSLFPGFAAPDQAGGEVKEFTDEAARKVYLKDHRKNLKAMCREIQLGVCSAMLALQHSQLDLKTIDHERLGVEFGANLMLSAPSILKDAVVASMEPGDSAFHFEKWGPCGFPAMEPLWLLRYLPNMPACHISIASDARGPSNSLTLDDSSCNVAVGEAQRILLRGAADVMITGSTGTTLHPIKTLHLALWHEMALTPHEPQRRSRPFDRDRSGKVVAEGACSLILEDRAHAEARHAKIWGRVLGTGASTVTDRTGKPLYRRALAQAMRSALRAAGVSPEEVGHINAHGAGMKDIDQQEAEAIHDVFGSDLGSRVPVTATKSFLGSAGAGSGSLEIAASLVGLAHGVIPATLNYDTPDPDMPRLNIVTGEPRPAANKIVLSLNVTRLAQASASVIEAA
ncbi:MAG: beta-ketoacyl-[acyl-carrier-protein] synthase family protein [Planctomycetaceae bacterium]|nr:beta-ketoacyl-[acyl-carrier-protein] synthase family protein [Planctomycetaceae bacterium]